MNGGGGMTGGGAGGGGGGGEYQWILCAGLIIFVIAAFCVLVSKDNKEEVKGAFVREGGYQSECLYQSARKCMSCASRD